MTPEEMAEARFRAMASPEMSDAELDALWDRVWNETQERVVRMERTAGGLARSAPQLGDSTRVLRGLFAADPDSTDALMDQYDRERMPAPAARHEPDAGLGFLEKMQAGLALGSRDVAGRYGLGAVRAADNLTGGSIGPLNRLRARTDRTQRAWDSDAETLDPHLGATGNVAKFGTMLGAEGAAFMGGGAGLAAAWPRYRRLWQSANQAGKGLRGAGERVVAGLPVAAAQGNIEKYGNDMSTGGALGWHVGAGAVGDAALPPAFRRLGSFFGGMGDGFKMLRNAPPAAPPAAAPPPRTMDDILGNFELRDDIPTARRYELPEPDDYRPWLNRRSSP